MSKESIAAFQKLSLTVGELNRQIREYCEAFPDHAVDVEVLRSSSPAANPIILVSAGKPAD